MTEKEYALLDELCIFFALNEILSCLQNILNMALQFLYQLNLGWFELLQLKFCFLNFLIELCELLLVLPDIILELFRSSVKIACELRDRPVRQERREEITSRVVMIVVNLLA